MDNLLNSIKGPDKLEECKETLLQKDIDTINEIVRDAQNNTVYDDDNNDDNKNYNRLDDSDENDDITALDKFNRLLSLCTCNLFNNTFAFL